MSEDDTVKDIAMEIQVGMASMDDVANMLHILAKEPCVDDLDNRHILEIAAQVRSVPQLLRRAITILNAVSEANGEDGRVGAGVPMISLSLVEFCPKEKPDES